MFNDAKFSDDDWKGIRAPGMGSMKRDQPEKVGKFGLGFSSVYHITGNLFLSPKNLFVLKLFWHVLKIFQLFS